ncbi:MAG: site-specific DNA-methyltransferase [Treponema sp.]|nr:site-specific DNA-methyltransferase [Treponema sp.]
MSKENIFIFTEQILSKEKGFCSSDGKLLRSAVLEAAEKMNPILLELLINNEKTKMAYFVDINGTLVFDKVRFCHILQNKSFLPDSITMYKNKIGLVDTFGEYLSSKKDVVLVFPHKDCILEGDQSREDQKKDEVFYNEILAPDQVTNLLSPKAFCNAMRYEEKNKYINKHLETNLFDTDNLIIKGNNLLALSSLLKRYVEKINCIYIDPPFNTGNDSFNYNDNFSRSTWLTFMQNRLVLARKLLSQDGNIFIHIDINQSHYLKTLADEIFGEENFVEEIIWAYGSPSGGRAATPKPVNIHDYILHYAKSYSNRKQNRVYIPYSEKYVNDWFKYTDDDGRKYQRRQRGKDDSGNPIWTKQYLDESKGIPLSTVWNDIQQVYADPRAYKEGNKADVEVIKEFSGGQKPEALIKRIIEMTTDEQDIVLDFHLGTGTTAATAHKMNRRYIGIEQIDSQIQIIIKRLQKVISGETAGISKAVNWQGGGSFVYCELAQQNQSFLDQIQECKTDKEITTLTDNILKSDFVSTKINPSDVDVNAKEYKELTFENKKVFAMEILDKNMLYINSSDIDDETLPLSDKDRAFTKSFYDKVD